jgi:hypothetical protein
MMVIIEHTFPVQGDASCMTCNLIDKNEWVNYLPAGQMIRERRNVKPESR